MTLKIYGLPLQHNFMAIKALARLAKLDIELVPTDLMKGEHLTPEFVAKFPMHCIPALEDTENGLCITETNAILRYLAAKSGSSSLYPLTGEARDLKQGAVCDMILDVKAASFGPDLGKLIIYPAAGFGAPLSEEEAKTVTEKLQKDKWASIAKFIKESGGPFICGKEVSIGDLSVWGFLKVALCLDGGHKLWEGCGGVREYVKAIEEVVGGGFEENMGFWEGIAAKGK